MAMEIRRRRGIGGPVARVLAASPIVVAGLVALAVPVAAAPNEVDEPTSTAVSNVEPSDVEQGAPVVDTTEEESTEDESGDDCSAAGFGSSGSVGSGPGSAVSSPVSSATFGSACAGSVVGLDLGSLGSWFVGS
ncbi:hypothetical protein [Rhodococcus xishaensis]|nr:hypothetical protein [Rhodococcus xishaensis]